VRLPGTTIVLDLGLVLAGCAIAGCRMLPKSMPTTDEVDRIVVSSPNGSAEESWDKPPLIRIIDDRRIIDRVIAFLSARDRGWHQLLDTPPNSNHTVIFERDGRVVFSFGLQRDSMDSYFRSGAYKARELNSQDSKQIRQLLGITTSDD
jgi:hypothetical protein